MSDFAEFNKAHVFEPNPLYAALKQCKLCGKRPSEIPRGMHVTAEELPRLVACRSIPHEFEATQPGGNFCVQCGDWSGGENHIVLPPMSDGPIDFNALLEREGTGLTLAADPKQAKPVVAPKKRGTAPSAWIQARVAPEKKALFHLILARYPTMTINDLLTEAVDDLLRKHGVME